MIVKEAIQSSIVGVGDGVKVIVGTGDGVMVSIMTCGAVSVATGETGADWQAVRKIKTNRQMRCFMNRLYQKAYRHGEPRALNGEWAKQSPTLRGHFPALSGYAFSQ